MPRAKKLQPIKEIEHQRAGIKAMIFYDPNEGKNDHLITLGGETYRHKDIDLVERWSYQKMNEMANYTWAPVISVKRDLSVTYRSSTGMGYEMRYKERLGVEVERYYITRQSDGTYLSTVWDTSPENMLDASQARQFYWHEKTRGIFTPPCSNDPSGAFETSQEHFLPYTEQTWAALASIIEAIRNAREQLEFLLSTPAGIQMLETVGGGMALLAAAPAPVVEE